MPQLTEQTLEKVCDGTAAITEPWVKLTRHETAVNRTGSAILHGWREPFELWESARERRDPQLRWTCEKCAETGVMASSDLSNWSSSAAAHQLTHVDGPFDAMPKLMISEVER